MTNPTLLVSVVSSSYNKCSCFGCVLILVSDPLGTVCAITTNCHLPIRLAPGPLLLPNTHPHKLGQLGLTLAGVVYLYNKALYPSRRCKILDRTEKHLRTSELTRGDFDLTSDPPLLKTRYIVQIQT